MTAQPNGGGPADPPLNRRLAILLAMAMFVLVVDGLATAVRRPDWNCST